MKETKKNIVLKEMLKEAELPDGGYEKAIKRYNDIGKWFNRDGSSIKKFVPHIFSQGSFRLGTAIKPLNEDDEYDLDLSCKLQDGVTKYTHTQEQLKHLVGVELEDYRVARQIQEKLEPKHRCWRLNYQDELKFHADIVPCIPEEQEQIIVLTEVLRKSEADIISDSAEMTVVITDDRDLSYRAITNKWKISNPEGYVTWFERRMKNQTRLDNMLEKAEAKFDDVPIYKKKTPLQQVIQLLKRHRDKMFQNNSDIKPISIIITTLAARAYNGEADLASALENILTKMESFVQRTSPRVPNPVDPNEDFADRWGMEKYKDLNFEKNFYSWIEQAKADFKKILNTEDVKIITENAKSRFSIILNEGELKKSLGISTVAPRTSSTRVQIIDENKTAKPWMS